MGLGFFYWVESADPMGSEIFLLGSGFFYQVGALLQWVREFFYQVERESHWV